MKIIIYPTLELIKIYNKRIRESLSYIVISYIDILSCMQNTIIIAVSSYLPASVEKKTSFFLHVVSILLNYRILYVLILSILLLDWIHDNFSFFANRSFFHIAKLL